MSAQRLALTNFIRTGPRFASLPQHPVQAQNEPHSEDDTITSGRLGLTETVVPLVNLLCVTPQPAQFNANLSGSHWFPPISLDVGGALKHRLLQSAGDRVIFLPHQKPKTAEVSVQTDDTGESVTASVERLDRLKWELENEIAVDLMNEGMRTEAIRRFQVAASNGNVEAMNNLADCLFNGIGATENKKEAWHLWTQASLLGHSESMYSLAVCYLRGEGTVANAAEALHWMRRAARAGSSDAAFYLVVRLMRSEDVEAARHLIRTAARGEDFNREMRSWVEDECLPEPCLAMLREELAIGTTK